MSEPLDTGPQFDAQLTPAEGEDDHGDLLQMFDRWERDIQTKRGEWLEEAKVCYALEAGDQWDPEDIAMLTERGRIPVVFNIIAPTIDAVCGAEISNRQQVQYFPREPGDTGVADALTQGAEYMSDQANGDMEDSEAFRDTLICGEGWTHTEPEVDVQNVTLPRSRVDPKQMGVDPSSRKACYEDARYLRCEIPMSQDEFEEFKQSIGKPDAEADGQGLGVGKRATIVDPRQRYHNGMLGTGEDDEIIVCEWQWWVKEPIRLAALPDPDNEGVTKIVPLDERTFQQAMEIDPSIQHAQSTRKVYYRALVGGGEVLLKEVLKENAFRYKAITGKRNRNKGTWQGMVKPMSDPQRFLNKLYSEILHIVRTNAKGGVFAEEGAIKDIKQFEDSYAQADAITWMENGSLANANGSRIQPKIAPPIPMALFQLMEFARDMVRACTGVNEEILGIAGREQPGVLEAQRKQAAYGILGPYFDSKRRYTRDWGKLFLAMLRLYVPKSELVRVTDKGSAQYVELGYTLEAEEYDVVVDEAPNTPNQKAKVAAVLMPIMQQLVEGGILGPEDVGVMLEYLELPAALVKELQESIQKRAEAAQQPNPAQQAAEAAEVEKTQSETEKNRATAFKTATDAHLSHAKAAAEILAPPEPAQSPETA